MQRPSRILPGIALLALLGAGVASLSARSGADLTAGPALYEISITNLTSNQIISPPLVLTHNESVRLFTPGDQASAELAALAEDGDSSGLMAQLSTDPGVFDMTAGATGIDPGATLTVSLSADRAFPYLSLAGMLVTTNDAFIGLDGATSVPMDQEGAFLVPVWDAGSEANSENGMYIPGPPFGNGGVHDPAPAEGFIHLHSGIHGIADVAPQTYDWGSYGAMVRFRRL
ncbi:MAG: hypothetical protein DWQ01_06390 [Planctomycetota bacterium]|nr:MAG: hypothetical protein DWQ01_06390 [Planctomycetota bacterium]